MCIWLINQAGGLADLIAPQNDHAWHWRRRSPKYGLNASWLFHTALRQTPSRKSQVIRYTESEPKVMVAESRQLEHF